MARPVLRSFYHEVDMLEERWSGLGTSNCQPCIVVANQSASRVVRSGDATSVLGSPEDPCSCSEAGTSNTAADLTTAMSSLYSAPSCSYSNAHSMYIALSISKVVKCKEKLKVKSSCFQGRFVPSMTTS